MHDLLEKINRVKNCIKENTSEVTIFSQTISFQAKDNIQVQIRLYN